MRHNHDRDNVKEPAKIAPIVACEGGGPEAGSFVPMPCTDDVDDSSETILPHAFTVRRCANVFISSSVGRN